MDFSDANLFPEAAVILHDGKRITKERQCELKAIYLEGLIRFLDIYAQTEIGEGFDIDIIKIALYVNSSSFENDELYSFTCVEDIFKLCENLTLLGLPIWRFLKINQWQQNMLENSYTKCLIEIRKDAEKHSPCFGCIWFEQEDTFLGQYQKCSKPITNFELSRRGRHDPNKIKSCQWLTTLNSIPESINNLNDIRKKQFISSIPYAKDRFKKYLSKDPFKIPKTISEKDRVQLDIRYNPLDDLLCAFGNLKTKSERQTEIRKAMFVEGMIRFFEMYAQNEIGTDYVANIKEISLWVDDCDIEIINKVVCFEDVYAILENMIIDGLDINKFVKRRMD